MSDRKSSTALVKQHDDKTASGSSRHHDDNDKYGGSRRDRDNRGRGHDEGRSYYSHDDNDKYGGSRRDRDNRDRGHDEGRSHYSNAGGRFIPCTMYSLHKEYINALCKNFKVSFDKVADWCDEEYIRIDTTKDPREEPVENIDPLRQVVSKHDWENWEKEARRKKNFIAAERYYESKGISMDYNHHGQEEDEDDSDSD